MCSDSLSSWFTGATFVNEKQRQDTVVTASFTITLIKPSGTIAKTLQQMAVRLPFKSDSPFHCLWRYPWHPVAVTGQCSAHYPQLEQHRKMCHRCCITEASRFFMNFTFCCADLLLFLIRGEDDGGKKSFDRIQLFSQKIFGDCLLLNVIAINWNRWKGGTVVIQHGD